MARVELVVVDETKDGSVSRGLKADLRWRLVIVSYTHGFVFVSNPKAASTSIETALSGYQERGDLDAIARHGLYTSRHMPAVELRKHLGHEQWDTMFKFGVVRHPYDWFVSQLTYNYRRLELPIPSDRLLNESDVTDLFALLRDRRGRTASPSASQWAFLCDASWEPLVDYLIPLERINAGWPQMCVRLGVAVPEPPQLNRTDHPAWRDWLSSSALDTAASLWADDFVLYDTACSQNLAERPSV